MTFSGYTEIRDVAEQITLATYSDKYLLSQQVSECYLTIGLNQMLTFQGYGGYETWVSKAGCFPLDQNDTMAGLGLDISLGKWVSGMAFKLRYIIFGHQDMNYSTRNWNGYDMVGHAEMWF
jgi:hypothetical protein